MRRNVNEISLVVRIVAVNGIGHCITLANGFECKEIHSRECFHSMEKYFSMIPYFVIKDESCSNLQPVSGKTWYDMNVL